MSEFDKFAQNYDELLNQSVALSGDSSEYFTQYKARYFSELHHLAPGRTLDYGCGIGNLSLEIFRTVSGAQVDGFDVSADSIRQVPAELTQQGTFTSDLSGLKSSSYRYIIVSNVLHHIPPEQRPSVFRQFHGLLAPGGELVVFEHNPINPATRWVVAHCPFDEDAVLLRPAEIRQHLKTAKLQFVNTSYIVFFPRMLAFLRPIERRLGWLPAGAQYCLRGKK